MPYIYKYTDKEDEEVKYIGICKSYDRLHKRIEEHKHDNLGGSNIDWLIEYAYFESITDVQAMEGHLIALYGTTEYFNISKQNWGLCSFAPSTINWKLYTGKEDIGQTKAKDIQPVFETTNDTIPEMITLKEASLRTGLSYDRLRKMCLQNKIVHIRVGEGNKLGGKFLVNYGKLISFLSTTQEATA